MSAWLRSFQNIPGFGNVMLHLTFAGMWVEFALDKRLPFSLVIVGGVALAGVKEFWFDTRYEIPPQPVGSIAGGGALQDFFGYCLGIAVGTGLHLCAA